MHRAFFTEGISIGLELDTSILPRNTKLLANFLLRVMDQTEQDPIHFEVDGKNKSSSFLILFSSKLQYMKFEYFAFC